MRFVDDLKMVIDLLGMSLSGMKTYGIESDFLSFNSGSTATIGIAQETANLVVKRVHLYQINEHI